MEHILSAQIVVAPATVVVLLSATLVIIAVTAARVVPERERLVVTRWGRVVRVAGPGLALRVPLLERWQVVSMQPSRMQLGVSAVSSDGVPVHVQVGAVCRTVQPSLSPLARPDPQVATRAALESIVAREVGHAEVADLLALRLSLESALPKQLTATTSAFGVSVAEVEIQDIEVRLTMTLLESLRHARTEGGA